MDYDTEAIRKKVLEGMSLRVEYDLDGVELILRPLSYAEKSLLQSKALAGLSLDIDVTQIDAEADIQKQFMKSFGQKMDGEKIGAITLNSAEANAQICAWCIVDPGGKSIFSLDEVKHQFPPEQVPRIAEHVRAISGMGQEDQQKLEQFR